MIWGWRVAKACFFGGIRLWDCLRYWVQAPARTGTARAQGVFQRRGLLVPDSPNVFRDLRVRCTIDPVVPVGDLSAQGTLYVGLAQMDAALVQASSEPAELTWVEDDARLASVTGGPYAPSASVVVPHTAPGGGWSPVAGHYLLFRNPTSRDGFVAFCEAEDGSSVTVTIPVQIDSSWELIDAPFYWPSTIYERMNPGEPENTGGDFFRANVEYSFSSSDDLIYPPDYEALP